MSTITDANIATANNLLQWNTKNLVRDADLNKSEISQFFAPQFEVKANGSTYQANYDNYFDFLNSFRSTIKTLEYDLENFIVDEFHVVIPLKAKIQRNDYSNEMYDAILILKFDKQAKIILWHEVYVQIKH